MSEVGSAYVSILPSARGFGSKLSAQIDGDSVRAGDSAGRKAGGQFKSGFMGPLKGVALAGLGSLGVVGAFGKAISSAKDFDLTMRKVGVQTKESGRGLEALSALAIKMGRDTVFSAGDASAAMLELSKGGLTSAVIRGGALKSTLTLAAAGGLDLATSATFMSNALNGFGLAARDSGSVAAALAGGANASTASVESLGMALSQVGPGAKLAGLSLAETVAALAAFDNAGIKGSDAGTSLKTMLLNLVPTTKKASDEAKRLGVSFVKGNGEFKSLASVSGILKAKLGDLSASEQTLTLKKLFGNDAYRAAAILMQEGSAGIEKYTRSTSDLTAAEKLAKVGTAGAAGAWESLKGTMETLAISAGTKLLPSFTKIASGLGALINSLSTGRIEGEGFAGTMSTVGANLRAFGIIAMPVIGAVGDLAKVVAGLPVPVLAAAAAFVIAKSAVSGISGAVGGLGAKFTTAKAGATGFSGGLKGLSGVVGGPWTIALTAGIAVFGSFIAKHVAARAQVDALAASLDAATGAITRETRATVVNALEKSGALKQARAFGIGLKDVTDAALGNAVAQRRVSAALGEQVSANQAGVTAGRGAAVQNAETASKADALRKAIYGSSVALDAARQKSDRTREALGGLGAAAAAAGRDFSAGLAAGIDNGAFLAFAAATRLADGTTSVMKGVQGFDTRSPSKVTSRIGEFVSEGLAQGIRKGANKALTAVQEVVDKVKTKLSGLRDEARSLAGGIADSVRSIVDVSQIGAVISGTEGPSAADIESAAIAVERAKLAQTASAAGLDRREADLALASAQANLARLQTEAAAVVADRTPSLSETFAGFASQAKAFAQALAQMAARGLAPAVIAAVAAAGPASGLAAAQGLANASQSDLESVNASSAAIQAAAQAAGQAVLQTTPLPAQIKREEETLATLKRMERLAEADKTARFEIEGQDKLVLLVERKQRQNRRRG